MFASCALPVWRRDDFSRCFLVDYFQTLLPLVSCALSAVVILAQWYFHRVRQASKLRQHEYDNQTLINTVAAQEESLSDGDHGFPASTLQKTLSRQATSFVELDSPRGETALVVVEFIALLGQVAIGIAAVVLYASSSSASGTLYAAIAGLIVWSYITVLAACRLLLSASTWKLSFAHLWFHTAYLYGVQWLLEVWVFRSVLIRSPSKLARDLVIAEFCLTTVLVLIALTSRTGNRAVLLEYEGDIEPSREPLASPLSHAFFAWVDPIVWAGYKQPLELSQIWNVTLKDKAETALAQFRQVKKTNSLALRLLLHFKWPILAQGAWCMVASVFMFLPTILLKAILEFLEDQGKTPLTAAWLYVILLFVTDLIQAIANGQSLWIGRKVCIRLRAIIIGEIYAKTLRRKAAASAHTELAVNDEPAKKTWLTRAAALWNSRRGIKKDAKASPPPPSQVDAQASNGTIINLMSIDSFKVSEICAYLHFLWAAVPVQLIMAVVLLYRVLGLSSLAGISLMVLVLPLNLYIAKSFQSTQKRIMAATDQRIHATNEVLENIRIIKYFAWEQRFADKVNQKRDAELSALWKKYVLWAFAATVWSAVPILITFVSFFSFTVIERKPLIPSIAFPALSMFSLLRIPLDQLADMVAHVQESKVSVDRVEEFLDEEETEKYDQLRLSKLDNLAEPRIALENATLTWGSKSAADHLATDDFRLINIDLDFKPGKLNVIAGPTGSGKTSLLMALLGEMKLVSGLVFLPGGGNRQNLLPDPVTGLTESVAYCAQQAWLINATIKDNILFASPFDHHRYHAVISACALERDLDILDAGDQTLVGEKGITLSGGQKQRISLARAIYSNSKHVLLDDCLSAVDSHTAKHIFDEALTGPLMQQRTCILVSHNISLTLASASYMVVMQNGQVAAEGTPDEVVEAGALGDEFSKSHPASAKTSKAPSRVSSSRNLANGLAKTANGGVVVVEASSDKKPEKKAVDTRTETKAVGSVKTATIKMYLRSMGPWYYWVLAAAAFIATQVGSVATNVWIRQWANAYHISSTASSPSSHIYQLASVGTTYTKTRLFGLSAQSRPLISAASNAAAAAASLNAVTTLADNVDTGYYLGVYAVIGTTYVLICLSRELVLFSGSLHASLKIHNELLNSALRATFRFFDSTPLGQMTNRFSKDIQAIDQEVAPVAIGMIHSAASVFTIVLLISCITPGFLIPGFFICLLYVGTSLLYIHSSRDLKRIEAIQRSPLFQHFGETLTGVVTIRAYGDESRFLQDSHVRVNTHNRPFIYLWATNRWLAVRMDLGGALVSFFAGTFVVLNAKTLDAGAAGLVLSYAITFTENILWLVRLYAANEQNMNSVERVDEYIHIDHEAPARIPDTAPAPNWPANGAVEFIDYGTRYRPDLDLVLKNISLKIAAGTKVGVVGRTGAGKSSLAMALFRGLEAETGKIVIDGVDISQIGLQDLREAITIVPQDPTLFSGTLRNNLDPFDLYTDQDIFAALRSVQLIGGFPSSESGSATPASLSPPPTIVEPPAADHRDGGVDKKARTTASSNSTLTSGESAAAAAKGNKNIFLNLSTPIAESGSNLSQGQRQLLCLARALLKSPKILVMDEATASIDYATDTSIQTTLRELKNHTLITIAHRLQTIIDYDLILVLDRGAVVEFDTPWMLIKKEEGVFRSMCETSGQFENLFDVAKKVWEAKRLVDDS